jgi:hypothetical protein
MTDYLTMTQEQRSDLEREAYAAGDTDKAASIAALMEVIEERDALESDLESLKKETRDHTAYKQFFENCFERLGAHYPCPEVNFEHDCSVIFDAIEAGEAARAAGESEE